MDLDEQRVDSDSRRGPRQRRHERAVASAGSIATARVKHDPRYQKERGSKIVRPQLSPEILRTLERTVRSLNFFA